MKSELFETPEEYTKMWDSQTLASEIFGKALEQSKDQSKFFTEVVVDMLFEHSIRYQKRNFGLSLDDILQKVKTISHFDDEGRDGSGMEYGKTIIKKKMSK